MSLHTRPVTSALPSDNQISGIRAAPPTSSFSLDRVRDLGSGAIRSFASYLNTAASLIDRVTPTPASSAATNASNPLPPIDTIPVAPPLPSSLAPPRLPNQAPSLLTPIAASTLSSQSVGLSLSPNPNRITQTGQILITLDQMDNSDDAEINWNHELPRQTRSFVKKASIYATVARLESITGITIDPATAFAIVKDATTPNPLSGQPPALFEVVQTKPFYQTMNFWQKFRIWFDCKYAPSVIERCISQLATNVIDGTTSQILQNAGQSLTRLAHELSEIIKFHVGKYLHAIETYAQQPNSEGNLSLHIEAEMETFRNETQKQIISNFSRVLVQQFLPDSPFGHDWKNSSHRIVRILSTILFAPLDWIYWIAMRFLVLPHLIGAVIKEASQATQGNPFLHAIHVTLSAELAKIRRNLNAPETSEPEQATNFLNETTKTNLREIAAKLLKILELEPHPLREEMRAILQHGETESEPVSRLISGASQVFQGRSLSQLINVAAEAGITNLTSNGLAHFLRPEKVKEILGIFMKGANRIFDHQSLNLVEYENKKQEVRSSMHLLVAHFVGKGVEESLRNPSQAEDNGRIIRRSNQLGTRTLQTITQMEPSLTHIRQLSNVDSTSPDLLIAKIREASASLQTHATSLYIHDDSTSTEQVRQRMNQILQPITSSMQGIAQQLSQLLALQTQRKFNAELRAGLQSILSSLNEAARQIHTNPVQALAELQHFDLIMQRIEEIHTSPILVDVRNHFQALSNAIQRLQLQGTALTRIIGLGQRTGPLVVLASALKRQLSTRQAANPELLATTRTHIQATLEQIANEEIRNQLAQAVAAIEASTTLPTLDLAWRNMGSLLQQMRLRLEGEIVQGNSQFQTSTQQFSVFANQQIQSQDTASIQAQTNFQAVLLSLQANLAQLSTQATQLTDTQHQNTLLLPPINLHQYQDLGQQIGENIVRHPVVQHTMSSLQQIVETGQRMVHEGSNTVDEMTDSARRTATTAGAVGGGVTGAAMLGPIVTVGLGALGVPPPIAAAIGAPIAALGAGAAARWATNHSLNTVATATPPSTTTATSPSTATAATPPNPTPRTRPANPLNRIDDSLTALRDGLRAIDLPAIGRQVGGQVGALTDTVVSEGTTQIIQRVKEVITPKILQRINSFYRLIQDKNTSLGLAMSAFQSVNRHYLS